MEAAVHHSPADARPDRSTVDLPALLRRLAGEVRRAADLSRDIECAFDPAVFRPEAASEALRSAQNLDLLTQHLDALDAFLRALSLNAPSSCAMNLTRAANGIRLHAVKARICEEPPPADPAGSDLELF